MAALTVKKRHTIRKDELAELFTLLEKEIGPSAAKFRSDRVEMAEIDSPFVLYLVDKKPLLIKTDGVGLPNRPGSHRAAVPRADHRR